jgi:hypothetical protein
MAHQFTAGERVVWVSNFGLKRRADAEVVRVAHGRVLIRVLERSTNISHLALVERWVRPESLRRP